MTAREHFVAAARGEQTHRPPVGAWVHFGTALAARLPVTLASSGAR